MIDAVDSVHYTRGESFDSLFEAPPAHEDDLADNKSNHVRNGQPDSVVEPPAPGGVFVTDDEDAQQHNMQWQYDAEFETSSKRQTPPRVPESIFEPLRAAECAEASPVRMVADAIPAPRNSPTPRPSPSSSVVLKKTGSRPGSSSTILPEHVLTPTAILHRTERLLAEHGSRANVPVTLFDGVQSTRTSASPPPLISALIAGYSSEESSEDDIGGVKLPSRIRESIGIIFQRTQDAQRETPTASTPITAGSLPNQPSNPPTSQTNKVHQEISRHLNQSSERLNTTNMGRPIWGPVALPGPSPKKSGHPTEKKRAREHSPAPSISQAPKRTKGPFVDESSDEESSEPTAPVGRTTPTSLTALAEQNVGIASEPSNLRTTPNPTISAAVASSSPPAAPGQKKLNVNRLKQIIARNAQNTASRGGQKQNVNGNKEANSTKTSGKVNIGKPHSDAFLEADSKLNPKAASRQAVERVAVGKDVHAVQEAGNSKTAESVAENGKFKKPAMTVANSQAQLAPAPNPVTTNKPSGMNPAKAPATKPPPNKMSRNVSHSQSRDENVAQPQVTQPLGVEKGMIPLEGSQAKTSAVKAPDAQLKEKKIISNFTSKEPANKMTDRRRAEAPEPLLARALDQKSTIIPSMTASDLAHATKVISQDKSEASRVPSDSPQVLQENPASGQQTPIPETSTPKPSGTIVPTKSASGPVADTLPPKKKEVRAQVVKDAQAEHRTTEPTISPPPIQRKQTQRVVPVSSEKRKAEGAVDQEHNAKKTVRDSDISTDNKGGAAVAPQEATDVPKDDAATRKAVRTPTNKSTILPGKKTPAVGNLASSTAATQKDVKASELEAAKKAAHAVRINEMRRARRAKLVNAIGPTEISKSVDSAKPVEVAHSVTPLKCTENVKPTTAPTSTEGVTPTVRVKPTGGVEIASSLKSANRGKPTIPTRPAEDAPSASVKPIETVKPPVPFKPTDLEKLDKPTETSKNGTRHDTLMDMEVDDTLVILDMVPETHSSSEKSLTSTTSATLEEPLPFFHYTIHQKLYSSTDNPSIVASTQLISTPYTSIEEANRQAEQLINATQSHPSLYGIQFRSWLKSRDEHDCLCFAGTFITLQNQNEEKYHKIWVTRQPISKYANLAPPSPTSTPFLSKTLYILRLCKVIIPDDDCSSTPAPPIRQHVPLSSLGAGKGVQELHTILDTANRAARELQVLLSHKENPQNELDRMWQEEDGRRLWEMVYALDPTMNGGKTDAEGNGAKSGVEGREDRNGEVGGCWQSEFNGKEGEKYGLVVERVGLCGPRNV